MKKLLLVFCFAAFICAAAGPAVVRFDGAPKAGDSFLFEYRSQWISTRSLKLPGVEKPPEQCTDRVFFLNAHLHFKSVSELQCTVHALRSTKNGKTEAFGQLKNRTLRICLKENGDPPDVFLEKSGSGDVYAAGSVLSGTAEQQPLLSLPPEAAELIRHIFSGRPGDSLKNYFGREKQLQPGDQWKPDPAPILDILKKRGISVPERDLRMQAKYSGTESFRGKDCSVIQAFYETKLGSSYDFKLKWTLLFPVKVPNAGPVRMTRSAFEITSRILPPGSPLFSGNVLELIEKESADIQMLPQ